MNIFTSAIVKWYEEYGRELPWRETNDPYLIWISEIILQQTRVVQGYEYYMRFVQRFPDFKSLAEASEDEVMKYWQGLGYYSRARNLHTAARIINEIGHFPRTYEEVRKLKGVGDYTAAAICSFAYGMPYAVVDGNVYRVLSRYFGIDTPIDSTQGKKVFSSLADEMLHQTQPAIYNQAIMDFGALQCTPSSPNCMFCPLIETCLAYKEGLVQNLPVKEKKTKVTHRYFSYFFVRQGNDTYIRRRENNDIWRNLYEIPLLESEKPLEHGAIFNTTAYKDLFPASHLLSVSLIQHDVKHVLTHRIIHADLYEMTVSQDFKMPGNYLRISIQELEKNAYPRLLSHFFSLLLAQRT